MKSHLGCCLVLAVLVSLAFGSTLDLPFFMDDYLHLRLISDPEMGLVRIGANSYSTSPIPEEALRAALPWWCDPTFRFHYFRPVPTLTLAADYALAGKDPKGFHRTNLLVHVLSALLLYGFAVYLGLRPGYALLAALTAGLHPDHLFAVSWICNRDSPLGAVFLVLTLWTYGLFLDRAGGTGTRGRRAVLLALSLLFFMLGVLSKENLVLAPALLFVLTLTRPESRTRVVTWRERFARYLPLLPFFLLSYLYVTWYVTTGHGVSTGYLLISAENGLAGNLAIMAKNLYLYLVSLVLFLPPDFKGIQGLLFSGPVVAFVILLGASLAAVMAWKRQVLRIYPRLWFLLAWTLVFLSTPLWFVPLGRLLHTSVLGFCLFAALFLQGLADQVSRRLWRICLVAGFSLWFVGVPLAFNAATTAFLVGEGPKLHLDLDRQLTEMEQALPGQGHTVFLLNAPNPASVYLAGTVHEFHQAGTGIKVFALGNTKQVPAVDQVGEKDFCLRHPDGILDLDVSFPMIEIREGTEVGMPAFAARIARARPDLLEEACFTFPEPLNSPAYVFLVFENGIPRQVRFPAGEKDSGAIRPQALTRGGPLSASCGNRFQQIDPIWSKEGAGWRRFRSWELVCREWWRRSISRGRVMRSPCWRATPRSAA